MIKTQLKIPEIFITNFWKSFLILIGGLLFTVLAIYFTYLQNKINENQKFAIICGDLKQDINARLKAHAQLLRSGAAFFAASDSVSRNEWKEFNETEEINKNLPGILGIGYSLIIPKEKLAEHIQIIQKEGFPNYKVYPGGEREIYTSIIYLEPFAGRNLRAFGYDMFSEPVRRKAMEIARDSDFAALTGKVLLVQETDTDIQAGTLMYVPVYRNHLPVKSVDERRIAIKGWVYSPYRMNDLMNEILGSWDLPQGRRIRMKIFDDDIVSSKSQLYDSQENEPQLSKLKPNLSIILPLIFNGKHWTLLFEQHNPELNILSGNSRLVLISGILISLLLFILSHALINSQKRTKQILKLNSELEKHISDKDRYISILAHDLKSPFNVILGFLSLLSENIHKYTIDKIESQVSIINSSAKRIYNLLEEILLWARSQSGKLPFEPQKINFIDICAEITGDFKVLAEAKNIEINCICENEVLVFVDVNIFKTIMRNLISNAIKFTKNEGKINVSAVQNKIETIVSVSDNGIGIDQTKLESLFIFSQFESSPGTANEKGTGLGLLLCKDLVEKRGGSIWVVSEPAKGSNFSFSIPFTQDEKKD